MGSSQTQLVAAEKVVVTPDWVADWKRATIFFCSTVVLVLLTYWNTVKELVSTWDSASFSHCYLIVPISLYLIWTEKERIRQFRPQPALFALAFLPLLGAMWFVGDLGNVRLLQHLALVGTIITLFWAFFGNRALQAYRFPLAFLVFAVPFGESLVPPLQDFTADATLKLLTWSHIPVVLEGHLLILPNGSWEVAEACSGIRYLLSSFVLGLVFVHLVYHSWRRRVGFMVLAVVFPIVANALRAYGIVVLGYLSNNQLAAGVDHIIYGWVFFTFVTLSLFSIGFRWREDRTEPVEAADTAPTTPAVTARTFATVTVLAAVIFAVPAVGSRYVAGRLSEPTATGNIPQVISPWSPLSYTGQPWIEESESAKLSIYQAYSDGLSKVRLHVAYYPVAGEGVDLQHFGRRLLSREFAPVSNTFRSVSIDGKPGQVEELVTRPSAAGQRVFWSAFFVDGEFTTSAYRVKALQARARLRASSKTSAIFSISADYSGDPSEARAALQEFLNHIALQQQLSSSFQ